MDESFHIHLASNVQPEIFPENNPTKFSTNLAEEIEVRGSGWEVAVKDITYPTATSSITSNDKLFFYPVIDRDRKIIPRVEDHYGMYKPHVISINLESLSPGTRDQRADMVLNRIKKAIDNPLNKTIAFRYLEDKGKFILNILTKDFIIVLSKALQKYLGFNTDILHSVETWAWSTYNPRMPAPAKEETLIFCYDLTHMKKTSFDMDLYASQITMACPTPPCKTTAQVSYESNFKALDPNDKAATEFMSSYLFTLNGTAGKFISMARQGEENDYFKYIKRKLKIVFIKVDSPAVDIFKMEDIYWTDSQFPHFSFPPNPRNTSKELPYIRIHVYTNEFSNPDDYKEIDIKKKETLAFKSEKALTSPKDYLPILNAKKDIFNYDFIFLNDINRFRLKVGKTFCLEMSPSLSSILGFTDNDQLSTRKCNSLTTATNFPILDRGINNLYVYSNIVESVFVGNVKAPLLLVCPLKREDELTKVHQVEFLNPTYTKLNRNTLQQIDIEIYDDAGEAVPFLYGKTVLTLHFRKR